MAVRKSKKGTPSPGPKGRRALGLKGSVSWEEHGERARASVAFSTDFFAHANADNIAKSSSEVTAKNSYFAGMLDMLDVARHAFGFWGADQMLQELERLNIRRCQSAKTPDAPEAGSVSGRGGGAPEAVGNGQPPLKTGHGTAKVAPRDPMFA